MEREPTAEELLKSTTSSIKPLEEIRRVKRERRWAFEKSQGRQRQESAKGRDLELHITPLIRQIDAEFARAKDLGNFVQIVAGVFKELTEFDRAMVYEFDETWCGRVTAELLDPTTSSDVFLGLRFPATDIPAQARELYTINEVRMLHDRDRKTSRLCCRNLEEVGKTLDLGHSLLRAVAEVHLEYLRNLSVRSTMNVSIIVHGKLWGLVSLHHYGTKGHRVSFKIRQLCRYLSKSMGTNIEKLLMAARLSARKVVTANPSSDHPAGGYYIAATAKDLLALFNADFGCLSIGEEAKILGTVENSQELLALLEYLRRKAHTVVQVTTDIEEDYPDIDFGPGFTDIAGFLAVPLSRGGKDFVVFCRRGHVEHVRWAGNPYAVPNEVQGVVEARKNFKVWEETVVGKCRPWKDEQLDTPQTLLLIYGKFIDVWREKESLLSATRLANLLLLDASKAVRTPLGAVLEYLELALEGTLDAETRQNVSTSYDASRTLVHVINDLLDLTRTEEGNDLFLRDSFNLPASIEAGVEMHRKEAHRRGLSLEVIETPQGTPTMVSGDAAKIQRIVANIVANAVEHTAEGGVSIVWGELIDHDVKDAEDKLDSIRIGISVTDTGCGISTQRLELMFREFEHMSTLTNDDQKDTPVAVGLGLALVARIVRIIGGQLRVESQLGQGSKFTVIIPFRLASRPGDDLPPAPDFAALTSSFPAADGMTEVESIMAALTTSHLHANSKVFSTRSDRPSDGSAALSTISSASAPFITSNPFLQTDSQRKQSFNSSASTSPTTQFLRRGISPVPGSSSRGSSDSGASKGTWRDHLSDRTRDSSKNIMEEKRELV